LASAALSLPIALSRIGPSTAMRISRAVSFASVIFGLFYGGTILAAALSGHPLS